MMNGNIVNFQILLQSDENIFLMLLTARKYCHDCLIYFAIQMCTYHAICDVVGEVYYFTCLGWGRVKLKFEMMV